MSQIKKLKHKKTAIIREKQFPESVSEVRSIWGDIGCHFRFGFLKLNLVLLNCYRIFAT